MKILLVHTNALVLLAFKVKLQQIRPQTVQILTNVMLTMAAITFTIVPSTPLVLTMTVHSNVNAILVTVVMVPFAKMSTNVPIQL